ncbi:MAG: hypothetical protein ACHQKZ_10595 [Solirubrobacterales bacterium]
MTRAESRAYSPFVAFSARPRRPTLVPRDTDVPEGRPRPRANYGAGNYIGCSACGRLMKIEWPVRSLVCSCGERVNVGPLNGK